MSKRIIHSKFIDFVFIKFPIIFPVIYGLMLYNFPQFENFLILATLILLAEPHFGATWPFMINEFNKPKIISEKINFMIFPILITVISLILFFVNKNLLYLIFYIANFYHVTRQSTGVSKLYISRESSSEINIHTYLIYFFGVIFGIIGLLRFQFVNLFNFNLIVFNVYIISFIILVIIIYFIKYRNFEKCFLLTTGILIFYPVCFVNAPIHAIIMGVTMHYTQYIFITYKVNLGRIIESKSKNNFPMKNFLLIIIIYGLIMGFLNMSNNLNNYAIGYLIIIPLIGQLLHFYFDTLLWKFSDKHNRNVTLRFI